MSNVVFFRSRVAPSEHHRFGGIGLKSCACAIVRLHPAQRSTLAAVWHFNAAGRLECRWSSQENAPVDEARPRAFSREAGTGSHEESASKQRARAIGRSNWIGSCSSDDWNGRAA